jgi:hypothetical protein
VTALENTCVEVKESNFRVVVRSKCVKVEESITQEVVKYTCVEEQERMFRDVVRWGPKRKIAIVQESKPSRHPWANQMRQC